MIDLAQFSNYIAGVVKTFIQGVYYNTIVNIGGANISLLTIILSGMAVTGATAVIGIALNRY